MAPADQEPVSLASRVSKARDAVAKLYPNQVIVPSSAAFSEAQKSFWNALQRDKVPACIFQPVKADQVQKAVVQVVKARCPFAIKGGGHSSNVNGSSIHGGFQFDLVHLDHIEIAPDKQSVRVGPGLRWDALYKALEPHGLVAIGGRDAGVGVPGFVFGGGLSYHSNEHGWGVDNLVSADIVLANGDLVTASSTSHPDLSRALHGGGAHNFGIVTNLTLRVYPYKGMWGGMNVVSAKHFDTVFDAYETYTHNLSEDMKAHMIMDFSRKNGALLVAQFMGYTEPLSDPVIYDNIRRIPNITNTLRLANISELAEEMAIVTDSRGKRNAYWTLAMQYDITLLRSAFDLWVKETEPYATLFSFAFDINHITPAMRNKAALEGTRNVYGLEGPNEPLTNILLTAVWEKQSDDQQVSTILKSLGTAIEMLAKQNSKSILFKYMNYAHQDQDIITGFGQENKAFLKKIAAKYDPEGVFQNLQLGGFKLDVKPKS